MVSFQKSDTPTPLFIDVSGDFNRHEWCTVFICLSNYCSPFKNMLYSNTFSYFSKSIVTASFITAFIVIPFHSAILAARK